VIDWSFLQNLLMGEILIYIQLTEKIIFYQILYTVQENIGLTLVNKLTTTHFNLKRNVMKVKIVAQTFSSSVADALEFF